ncbi:MAG TPA: polysaccharide biosynthesis/export family protein [bacterium]|nr:polysaccharide biosynthesis/export family protein [bacterium]
MKPRITILAALLLVTSLVDGSPAAPVQPPPTNPGVPDNYILGPGDQIEINVFGEPDLTRTVTIKPDGIIALPLINQVTATGKTAAQLEAELTRLYSKYLKKPSVSVLVRQFRMNPIYVMGEVSKPGRYDLTYEMTFLDALTLAGGATDKANLDGSQLVRVENGKNKAIPIKANQMIQGKAATPNLKLQPGDLIYVPRRGLGIMDILNNIGVLRMILGL